MKINIKISKSGEQKAGNGKDTSKKRNRKKKEGNSKNIAGKVAPPQTVNGQILCYNALTTYTLGQWAHSGSGPSGNLSMVGPENVLSVQPLRNNVQESTYSRLSEEQLRMIYNSIMLKRDEDRTKQWLERKKQKRNEAVRKAEEEDFRYEVSKYVVECLNPFFAIDIKIETRTKLKKIAESYTKSVVEEAISAHRNQQMKPTLNDGLKQQIEQTIPQYVYERFTSL